MQFVFTALIYVVPFLLGILIPSTAMLGGRYARYLVYPYLAILIFFTGSSYGVLDDEALGSTIYGRGSGRLYFGFVNLYLYWLGLVVMFDSLWNRRSSPDAGIRKYLAAFVFLFFCHIVAGLYLDKSFFLIISRAGVLNIFNMIILVYVLLRVFNNYKHVDELMRFFLICALARGAFGLVRFFFFGGDPANYYSNFQNINVKLTFFDIDDSIIAGMAGFLAAWRLLERELTDKRRERLLYWSVLVVGILVILLSYRRTAWLGLLPPALLFIWWHRKRINFLAGLPVLLLLVAAVGGVWLKRFQGGGHAGLMETLFPDATSGGSVALESGRFVELQLALGTILDHWLLGVGTWGEYQYSQRSEVGFHGGVFSYMHSGFLHVWLKTGLLGLVLFAGALLTSAATGLQGRASIDVPRWRGLAMTGFAGLLLFMPTLLFGTPVIEYRTMQIMGLVLVLPYLARYAMATYKAGH